MDPSWVNVKLAAIFRRNLQVLHIADEIINEILLTRKDGFWGRFQKKCKECVTDINELMYIDMRTWGFHFCEFTKWFVHQDTISIVKALMISRWRYFTLNQFNGNRRVLTWWLVLSTYNFGLRQLYDGFLTSGVPMVFWKPKEDISSSSSSSSKKHTGIIMKIIMIIVTITWIIIIIIIIIKIINLIITSPSSWKSSSSSSSWFFISPFKSV